MDIACEADQCWYKNNTDRAITEYCESTNTQVVASDIGDPTRDFGISAYPLEAEFVILCDVCIHRILYDCTNCSVCGLYMIDNWITSDHINTMCALLGESKTSYDEFTHVCRMCLNYEDTDDFESIIFSDDPDLDMDMYHCGSFYGGKWLSQFGESDEYFHVPDCPTKNECVVDLKVRTYLAKELSHALKEAKQRHADRKKK